LLDDNISEGKIEELSETLERVLGDDHKLLNCMLFIYNKPQIIEEINELDVEFSDWIFRQSIRNGFELNRLFRLMNEHVDWDKLSHRVFYDGEIFLELEIQRLDGKKFIIESNRVSVLILIATLSNKLSLFQNSELNDIEKNAINDTISNLNNLIAANENIE